MIRTQNARDKKRMKMDDMEVTIKQLQQQNKILAKQVTINTIQHFFFVSVSPGREVLLEGKARYSRPPCTN